MEWRALRRGGFVDSRYGQLGGGESRGTAGAARCGLRDDCPSGGARSRTGATPGLGRSAGDAGHQAGGGVLGHRQEGASASFPRLCTHAYAPDGGRGARRRRVSELRHRSPWRLGQAAAGGHRGGAWLGAGRRASLSGAALPRLRAALGTESGRRRGRRWEAAPRCRAGEPDCDIARGGTAAAADHSVVPAHRLSSAPEPRCPHSRARACGPRRGTDDRGDSGAGASESGGPCRRDRLAGGRTQSLRLDLQHPERALLCLPRAGQRRGG